MSRIILLCMGKIEVAHGAEQPTGLGERRKKFFILILENFKKVKKLKSNVFLPNYGKEPGAIMLFRLGCHHF